MENEKTPWNPSKKAIKRVKDVVPVPETCPYCGGEVVVETHKQHYGRDYGEWNWMYVCRVCKASVGMHPFTNIPLGTLANEELRQLRKKAKELVFKTKNCDRLAVYHKLSLQLNIPVAETHFGFFDTDTCLKIISIYRG